MIIPFKYTDKLILWVVTAAAVIVSVAQFIYLSWKENNVGEKIRIFIHQISMMMSKLFTAIAEETNGVPVAVVVTPQPKKGKKS